VCLDNYHNSVGIVVLVVSKVGYDARPRSVSDCHNNNYGPVENQHSLLWGWHINTKNSL
jgi:hypothetical protein